MRVIWHSSGVFPPPFLRGGELSACVASGAAELSEITAVDDVFWLAAIASHDKGLNAAPHAKHVPGDGEFAVASANRRERPPGSTARYCASLHCAPHHTR